MSVTADQNNVQKMITSENATAEEHTRQYEHSITPGGDVNTQNFQPDSEIHHSLDKKIKTSSSPTSLWLQQHHHQNSSHQNTEEPSAQCDHVRSFSNKNTQNIQPDNTEINHSLDKKIKTSSSPTSLWLQQHHHQPSHSENTEEPSAEDDHAPSFSNKNIRNFEPDTSETHNSLDNKIKTSSSPTSLWLQQHHHQNSHSQNTDDAPPEDCHFTTFSNKSIRNFEPDEAKIHDSPDEKTKSSSSSPTSLWLQQHHTHHQYQSHTQNTEESSAAEEQDHVPGFSDLERTFDDRGVVPDLRMYIDGVINVMDLPPTVVGPNFFFQDNDNDDDHEVSPFCDGGIISPRPVCVEPTRNHDVLVSNNSNSSSIADDNTNVVASLSSNNNDGMLYENASIPPHQVTYGTCLPESIFSTAASTMDHFTRAMTGRDYNSNYYRGGLAMAGGQLFSPQQLTSPMPSVEDSLHNIISGNTATTTTTGSDKNSSVTSNTSAAASLSSSSSSPSQGNGNTNEGQKKWSRWSKDEDQILRLAVAAEGQQAWKRIAEKYFHGTRKGIQCKNRWRKALQPGLVKGRWSQQEDKVIIDCVVNRGVTRWSDIANLLPGRIGEQVKERWFNALDPSIKKGAWSSEEILILKDAQRRMGNSWSKIAQLLPGRSENAVKNRWYNAKTSEKRALTRNNSLTKRESSGSGRDLNSHETKYLKTESTGSGQSLDNQPKNDVHF